LDSPAESAFDSSATNPMPAIMWRCGGYALTAESLNTAKTESLSYPCPGLAEAPLEWYTWVVHDVFTGCPKYLTYRGFLHWGGPWKRVPLSPPARSKFDLSRIGPRSRWTFQRWSRAFPADPPALDLLISEFTFERLDRLMRYPLVLHLHAMRYSASVNWKRPITSSS
jgi:hypothetical protein